MRQTGHMVKVSRGCFIESVRGRQESGPRFEPPIPSINRHNARPVSISKQLFYHT